MLFKDRKELADKYKIWVKQSIDNNHTMILDCAESLIAFLDLNGYMNKMVHGKWIKGVCNKCGFDWGKVAPIASVPNYCPNCGVKMERREDG